MDSETLAVIGMMLSPMYGLILWRVKVSAKIERKVTKICTALKLRFPELTDALND